MLRLGALAAGASALAATVLANLAAESTSLARSTNLVALDLARRSAEAAKRALCRLRQAKACAYAALAVVLAAVAAMVIVRPARATPTVLVVVDGRVVCGELRRSPIGALSVGGVVLVGTSGQAHQVSQLAVVSHCP